MLVGTAIWWESSWRDLQDLHAFAPLRPQYFSKHFGVFKTRNTKTFEFSIFIVIFADFHEICSAFLKFSRKCGKTLQLLKISRFQFNFIMIIREIHLIFRFNFQIGTLPCAGRHSLLVRRRIAELRGKLGWLLGGLRRHRWRALLALSAD